MTICRTKCLVCLTRTPLLFNLLVIRLIHIISLRFDVKFGYYKFIQDKIHFDNHHINRDVWVNYLNQNTSFRTKLYF